jgi:EmrB/QacA subfamily drug resistance transporter
MSLTSTVEAQAAEAPSDQHRDRGATATPVVSQGATKRIRGIREVDNASRLGTSSEIARNVAEESSPNEPSAAAEKKLSATAIALLMIPLCLSVTLSALDLTIVTPAVPAIVGSFKSVQGYVWIGSAFVLANTASTPIWGTVADIWGRKPVILVSVAIFSVGSLLCALAKDMNSVIAGRAIQGLGAAGMTTMVNVIICDTFSMRDRGFYLAITSGVWAIMSAVGPVIGGIFTTRLSWRWCFWINLPVAGIVFAVLLFYLNVPNPKTSVMAGLKAIDWVGSTLIVGGVLMILLGLDFGNVTFPWSSATVICLTVFGGLAVGVFVLVEWKVSPNPVIPLRLFSSKSSSAAYAVFSFNFYVFTGIAYYLPLYSQAVLGANALTSGLHLLPIIVACSLSAAFGGVFIQKTGVYLPLMHVSQVLLTLGTGLFIYLEFETSLIKLFIFQVLVGIGVGMNIEPPILAAQAAMTVRDTAAVIATMGFLRSIANAISIVLGGVIFQNKMNGSLSSLSEQLGHDTASKFGGDQAAASLEFINSLPESQQSIVRETYYTALRAVWIMVSPSRIRWSRKG